MGYVFECKITRTGEIMADIKVNIGDAESGKTYSVEISEKASGSMISSLVGRKINDEVDGRFVGLPGYRLLITGGSDKDGFPMRGDLSGPVRRRLLLSRGIGVRPKKKGIRKKKMIRGNQISPDIVQINMKVKQMGPKPIPDLIKEFTEQQSKKLE